MAEKRTFDFPTIHHALHTLDQVPDAGLFYRVKYSMTNPDSEALPVKDQVLILTALRFLLSNQSPEAKVVGFRVFSTNVDELSIYIQAILSTVSYTEAITQPKYG